MAGKTQESITNSKKQIANHKEIRRWRRKEALRKTFLKRPDLLEKVELTQEDLELLEEIKKELREEV